MLEANEIEDIINQTLKIEKKVSGFEELPFLKRVAKKEEFYAGYFMNVQAVDEIKVHAVRNTYPANIIDNRAPNMTDIERDYVKANYKQITMPVYVDFLNTIKRAFSDNNWSLSFTSDDGSEGGLWDYLDNGLKHTKLQMSLESFIKDVIPSIKTIDSMGCIAMKPEKIFTKELDGGETVIGDEALEPIPQYYSVEQLRNFVEGEYYLFLTNELSVVKIGNRNEQSGFIYELYDKMAIYRIIQTGAKKDNTYVVEEYFRHDEDRVPVKRLEGIPDYVDGSISWISPFSYAVPLLDDALIDANMLRGVKATTMFPYRVMVGNTCEYMMDIGGEIKQCGGAGYFHDYTNGDKNMITCKGCNGSGLRDRVSPSGTMLLKPEAIGEKSELISSQPAMQYVAPSVDVPKFTREEILRHINEARKILHIRESNTEVKGSEDMTATGMVIDEKALYSFIKPLSDQIFEMYGFIIEWTSIMRYNKEAEYILTAPITFDFKTEYDYLAEISMAIKNGLPPFVVHTIIIKYLKTLFYNQLESAHAFNVIVRADRLLTMDDEEVDMKLSQGIIADWEVVLHDSAVSFVMDLVAVDKGFFEKDIQVQIDALVEMAKKVALESKASKPQSPQQLVESIVNIPTPPITE